MSNTNTRSKKVYIIVECAIMIALSTVLSLVKIIPSLPLGGAVTLLSMLPICIVSVRRGIKWGVFAAFIYSVGQFFLGGAISWGLDAMTFIVCMLLDYIIAFTVLGLAGIFAKKGDSGIILGSIIALCLRFLCHFISGVTIWRKLDAWKAFGLTFESAPELYSLLYNGFYMIPEIIFTSIALIVLIKIPIFRKHLLIDKAD